ncbi:MAG: hypothetical protein AABM67_10985 [Acidobacteriota bacterium]
MFEPVAIRSAWPLVFLKRACVILLSIYLVIGLISAYRAFYQVRSLELRARDSILRNGSSVETSVVSYARTTVDVRLELIQGTHTETVNTLRVPGNEWAFFDPRNQKGAQTTVLTGDVLRRFQPGKAQLRATAIGRHQWMRLPPPVIRELEIEIRQD